VDLGGGGKEEQEKKIVGRGVGNRGGGTQDLQRMRYGEAIVIWFDGRESEKKRDVGRGKVKCCT